MPSEKIVLITGANSGIGFQTVIALLQSSTKYHVYLCSRSLANGKEALAELENLKITGSVSLLQVNITDQASVTAAAEAVKSAHGRLDVLINNAGIQIFQGDELSKLHDMFETNTFGAATVTEAFLPLLKQSSDARLIFVSSAIGSIGMRLQNEGAQPRGLWAYRMSKAALNMLMVCYQVDNEGALKAWAVCPGLVVTKIGGDPEAVRAMGGGDPSVSAQTILGIVEGKRDADVGKFVHKDGIYPW